MCKPRGRARENFDLTAANGRDNIAAMKRHADTDAPTGPRAYYVTANRMPICFVAARNSALALIAADKVVREREIWPNGKPSPSTMTAAQMRDCLHTFSTLRWRECPTLCGELVDGELIDLTDPDCIGRWWESLTNMRLADGSPDAPEFTHQPPAHARAYKRHHAAA